MTSGFLAIIRNGTMAHKEKFCWFIQNMRIKKFFLLQFS